MAPTNRLEWRLNATVWCMVRHAVPDGASLMHCRLPLLAAQPSAAHRAAASPGPQCLPGATVPPRPRRPACSAPRPLLRRRQRRTWG